MKEIALFYEQSKATEDEVRRRVETAFDVLFECVFDEIKDFRHMHKLASSKREDDGEITLPTSA